MASSLNGTGVTFSDSTQQASAWPGVRAQLFTSTGTFTVPAGITAIKVTVVGGGGGGATVTSGGYVGGGGGGGGAAITFITGLTPGATITATVGAAGAASSAGGTSSFGAYASATGGSGGTQHAPTTTNVNSGGAGGTGTGTFAFTGSRGATGGQTSISCSTYYCGGAGGGAGRGGFMPYMYSVIQQTAATVAEGGILGGVSGASFYKNVSGTYPGNAATGYGNGGGGAIKFAVNGTGGSGSAGCVLVEW